jgi:hypothetical protein
VFVQIRLLSLIPPHPALSPPCLPAGRLSIPRALVLSAVEGSDRGGEWVDAVYFYSGFFSPEGAVSSFFISNFDLISLTK